MNTDVVIIGASVAGAATAFNLAARGIRAVMVEKEEFPRFHIGESLTGEAGKCLRRWGLEPEIVERGCYVKHGVRVYGPGGKSEFWIPVMSRDSEGALVDSSTWHVTRSDFDRLLRDHAKARGAALVKGRAVDVLRAADGSPCGLRYQTPAGDLAEIHAKVVVDASGAATFLSHAGVTGPKQLGKYDKQLAIFSHVRARSDDPGTIICYQRMNHWSWYIPLEEDVISVGVVTPGHYYREQGRERGEDKQGFLRREIQQINPELSRRLPDPEFIGQTRGISNYSYHIEEFTGPGYLCVGDSHRFIDPIFSFGVYFGLKEAEYAAEAIEAHLRDGGSGAENPFLDYQHFVERGQDLIQDLIDVFWKQPLAFAFMAHHRHREHLIDIFAGRIYGQREQLDTIRGVLDQIKAMPSSSPDPGPGPSAQPRQ